LAPHIPVTRLHRAFAKIRACLGQLPQLQCQERSRGRKREVERRGYEFRGCCGNRMLFCMLTSKLLNHSISLRVQFSNWQKCPGLISMLVAGKGKDSLEKKDA